MNELGTRGGRLTATLLAGLMLIAFVFQCGFSMGRKSVTVDEFVHLPVGYSLLQNRDFLTDPINPPFMRMWAALPLLFDPPSWKYTSEQVQKGFWRVAYHFMLDNADQYQSIFIKARWMIVIISILLGIFVYKWASELYGNRAGLLALFLYTFSPNILAHSRLVTADLGGACFIFLATYYFWKMRRTNRWRYSFLSGLFVCLALISKLSAVFLLAVPLLILLLNHLKGFKEEGEKANRYFWQQWAVVGLFAFFLLHISFLGGGSFRPWGDYQFKSDLFSTIQWWMPKKLPVFIPEGFVQGIDEAIGESGDIPEDSFFLLGELSEKGWWYYFLVALLLKMPIPTLVAMFVAIKVKVAPQEKGRFNDEIYLLVPIAVFLVGISIFTSLYVGFRHILMILPFIFVWVSKLSCFLSMKSPKAAVCIVLGCLWYGSSALSIYPNYLAYFNELAGGPKGGHQYLIDSNLDWGQDLIQLKEYLDRRGNPEIKFAYFGRVDPTIYGIRYQPLGSIPTNGIVVVSATFVHGRPYMYPLPNKDKKGQMAHIYQFAEPNYFAWIRKYEPIERVGHSLFVYEINEKDFRPY